MPATKLDAFQAAVASAMAKWGPTGPVFPLSDIDLGWEEPTAETDPSYPHKCPACAGPAYIGLALVSCKQRCKKEYAK